MRKVLALFARRIVKGRVQSLARSLKRRRIMRLRSIAYIIAGGMGDAIMTLPALTFLKKSASGAAIDVFVPPEHFAILSPLLRPFSLRPATLTGDLFRRYDVVFTNTIATFRVTCEVRARAIGRFAAGFCYPDERPVDRLYDFSLPLIAREHDIDQNLALVSGALGVPIAEIDRQYPPAPQRMPLQRGVPIPVLVHPGAGRDYRHKKWPFDRYVEIVRRLTEHECAVTVLLGPDESHLYAFFSKMAGVRICSSHGPDPLLNALSGSRLFIGNDSGPAHCASLFGIPAITLFGPTSAARNAPRGSGCTAIESAMPCAPCHFTRSPCRDNKCLKSISVDTVWAHVEERLKNLEK
jgi:ADP-heptose:LPS heptosyltransferase